MVHKDMVYHIEIADGKHIVVISQGIAGYGHHAVCVDLAVCTERHA